jgi:hypothetical protein
MASEGGQHVGAKSGNKRWLIVGSAVALGAGALAFSWMGKQDTSSKGANSAAALACTFTQGSRHSYDLGLEALSKIDSKSLLPTQDGRTPPIQDQRVGMVGKLHMQVLEASDKGATLAFSLEPQKDAITAELPQKELDALMAPVAVKVDPLCRFVSFGFGKEVGPAAQNQLRGILQSAQVVLAKDPKSKAWQHLEDDLAGRYGAKYVRVDDNPLAIRKTKFGYTEVFPPISKGTVDHNEAKQTYSARVRRSDTQVRWSEQNDWVEELVSVERVLFMSGDHLFADVSSTLALKRLPDAATKEAPVLANLSWVESKEPPAARPDFLAEPPDEFKTMKLEDALAQVASLIHQKDHGKAGHLLALLMRAQPALIDKLMAMVKSGELPAEMHSVYFFALEQTGTPEARKALIAALDDPNLQPENRMRAAVALPDIADPDESTLAALDRLAAYGGKLKDEANEQRLQNSATFALGTLENRMRNKKPELAKKARETILDHLRKAGDDPVEITAALDAIHNSGHPEFLDKLDPYFKSETELVRKHAYEALGRMPPDATAPLFESLLNGEADESQRALLAVTYADQARSARIAPPATVWGPAANRLPDERNPVVRASYVHLIGAAADSSPEAVAALADQYTKESDPRMLKAIGRYVPADKLPK